MLGSQNTFPKARISVPSARLRLGPIVFSALIWGPLGWADWDCVTLFATACVVFCSWRCSASRRRSPSELARSETRASRLLSPSSRSKTCYVVVFRPLMEDERLLSRSLKEVRKNDERNALVLSPVPGPRGLLWTVIRTQT